MDWKCGYEVLVDLDDMVPLQGMLKHRTQAHVDDLKASLELNGLLQPIILWESEGQYFIIDGHCRYTVMKQMGLHEQIPAVIIQAESADQARSFLLEMNVKYGRITPKSLSAFIKESPKVQVPVALNIKMPQAVKPVHVERTSRVVTLRVDIDKIVPFMDIISKLSYVEVV
jgi:hypothetical protein